MKAFSIQKKITSSVVLLHALFFFLIVSSAIQERPIRLNQKIAVISRVPIASIQPSTTQKSSTSSQKSAPIKKAPLVQKKTAPVQKKTTPNTPTSIQETNQQRLKKALQGTTIAQGLQSQTKTTSSEMKSNVIATNEETPSVSGVLWQKTKEEAYIDLLIAAIEREVQLAPSETITIELSLFKTGTIESLRILSSSNKKNDTYILQKIKKITFPSFAAFCKKEKKTFKIILETE